MPEQIISVSAQVFAEKRDGTLNSGNLSEFSEGMIYKGGQGVEKSQDIAQNLWTSNRGKLPLWGPSSDLRCSSGMQGPSGIEGTKQIPLISCPFLCLISCQYSSLVKPYRKSEGKKAPSCSAQRSTKMNIGKFIEFKSPTTSTFRNLWPICNHLYMMNENFCFRRY